MELLAETSVLFKLKGDTKNLDGSLDKSGGKAAKLGSSLKTAFAVGVAAAAAGFAAITKMAVDAFADYEQLVGGVETLFKESSDVVMKYADNAYKTAGMSANQYMETVTGFSASLLQSLGGDTKKAAEIGNMAVTDMADNANKMGTSIGSIQDAYQGFAKQNYTMLDNLKLGYGGTKEEMQRLLKDAEKLSGVKYDISNLNDVYEAIHVVQTELGITGTTAKEASTTIQGSTAMMKASWSNLMTGLADDTQDFDKLLNNFIESIGVMLSNLLPVVQTVVTSIFTMIQGLLPKLVGMFKELLPIAVQGIADILKGVVEVLPTIVDAIVGVIPLVIESLLSMLPLLISAGVDIILSILKGISESMPKIIMKVIEMLPKIIDALIDAIPALIDGAIKFFMAIINAIPVIIQKLAPQIPKIVKSIIDGLIKNLPALIKGAIQLFMALVKAIPIIIKQLIPMYPQIISAIIKGLLDNLPALIDGAVQLFMALIYAIPLIIEQLVAQLPSIVATVITSLIEPLNSLFGGVWNNITKLFGNVGAWFGEKFSEAWQFIKDAFSEFGEFFNGLWDGIKNGVTGAWKFILNMLSSGGKIFDGIVGSIGGLFKSIVGTIISGINKVIAAPFEVVSGALKFIHNIDLGWPIGKPFTIVPNGIDIPQIPTFLAKGGIVDKATFAVVGEAGEEAIVPMSDDRMLSRLADKINGASSGSGYGIHIGHLTIESNATDLSQLEADLITLAAERGF